MDFLNEFRKFLMADLECYAKCRVAEVEAGTLTPELAALLVDRYGNGIAKAISTAEEFHNVPSTRFLSFVDSVVMSIDPEAPIHRELMNLAHPASVAVSLGIATSAEICEN